MLGGKLIIIIINVSFYGLQSIFRCIHLFDLKEASGRQDKEVIKNMDSRGQTVWAQLLAA